MLKGGGGRWVIAGRPYILYLGGRNVCGDSAWVLLAVHVHFGVMFGGMKPGGMLLLDWQTSFSLMFVFINWERK